MGKPERLTPLDVIHASFSKSLRGYSMQDVDEFKEKVAKAIETLLEENQQMKEKIQVLDEKLRDYNTKEITLQNTLVLAEKSAEDRLSSARKEADLILEEARVRASREKEMLQKETESLREEKKKIYMEREKYLTDIELLAQTQLGLLKKYKGNE